MFETILRCSHYSNKSKVWYACMCPWWCACMHVSMCAFQGLFLVSVQRKCFNLALNIVSLCYLVSVGSQCLCLDSSDWRTPCLLYLCLSRTIAVEINRKWSLGGEILAYWTFLFMRVQSVLFLLKRNDSVAPKVAWGIQSQRREQTISTCHYVSVKFVQWDSAMRYA